MGKFFQCRLPRTLRVVRESSCPMIDVLTESMQLERSLPEVGNPTFQPIPTRHHIKSLLFSLTCALRERFRTMLMAETIQH